jgi:hypothetical protein
MGDIPAHAAGATGPSHSYLTDFGIGAEEDGAGDGIRTRDINLGKVALYQLSYSRLLVSLFSRGDPPRVNFTSARPVSRQQHLP